MSSAEAADLPKKKKNNKDYSNTTRVYDSDGYRLRADALIFKDEDKQEVCGYTCLMNQLGILSDFLTVHQIFIYFSL